MKTVVTYSLLIVSAFATASQAQPLFTSAESIESMVMNADHVFIGRVQKLQQVVPQRSDSNAVVTVEQRLKAPDPLVGPHPAVQTYLPARESQIREWKDSNCRLLVAADWDTSQFNRVVPLDGETLEAMSADLQLIKDPAEVIRIAKAVLRNAPANVKRIHTFRLAVPREIIKGTRWEQYYDTGGHLLLYVPVDQRLEARAQRYLKSESPFTRTEGAEAIRYFKTDENIALLRTLLDDPYKYPHSSWEGYEGPVNHYSVRYTAYNTFKVWNVDVDKPVIIEQANEPAE